MIDLGRHGSTLRRIVAIGSVSLACSMARVPAQSPAASASTSPPRSVSWQGDPDAPPLSGVWRLVPATGGASKEGWAPWPPPLKGAFAERWRQAAAAAQAGSRDDDPVVGCEPPGMPRFITGDLSPLLVIQSKDRVTLYRDGLGPRRIWPDGRKLPDDKHLEPFYSGTSIGRYDGQDLVIETIGLKDLPIDATGVPHSDRLRITERYHRVDAVTLRIMVTLADPLAYARPLSSTVTYRRVEDPLWEPREFICTPRTDYHPDRYVH